MTSPRSASRTRRISAKRLSTDARASVDSSQAEAGDEVIVSYELRHANGSAGYNTEILTSIMTTRSREQRSTLAGTSDHAGA